MKRVILSLACAATIATPAVRTSAQGASGFTLVDGTKAGLSQVAIRRAGTNDWKPLDAPGKVQFKDPDCAFDIRATVAGAGPTTWAGINLCDIKSVTLKRDESAGAWVDYDE